MTLSGYFFTVTGLSCHAFFDGERCVCEVLSAVTPGAPIRICADRNAWMVLRGDRPDIAVLDPDGAEVAALYRWDRRRFEIAVPGASLSGRVVDQRLRRAIVYTALDGEVMGRIESGFDRDITRKWRGEAFPRRYVAELDDDLPPELAALALSAPFLGMDFLES